MGPDVIDDLSTEREQF